MGRRIFKEKDLIYVKKDCLKYNKITSNEVGVLFKKFMRPGVIKYGIIFSNLYNENAENGVFWFDDEDILPVKDNELIKEEFYENFKIQRKSFLNELNYIEINRKEENNMETETTETMKRKYCTKQETKGNKGVAKLYFDRCLKRVSEKRVKDSEHALNEDDNIIAIHEMFKNIIPSVSNINLATTFIENINLSPFAMPHTIENVKTIKENAKRDILAISKKRKEVFELLSGCTHYNEELDILLGYNILVKTENGIIMNMNYDI